MNNASGATDEAFEKMQTDSWDLNKAINEIKNVMIEFGGTLVETLRPAIEGFISGVTAFKDWFASIGPEGQRAIIGIRPWLRPSARCSSSSGASPAQSATSDRL